MTESLLEEIERRLKAKTIHELRQVARAVGVPRPADGKKERILEYVMQIAAGTSAPVAPAVRGAHPKSDEYDRQLVADIIRCREICSSEGGSDDRAIELEVGSGEKFDESDFSVEGILDFENDKYFICGKTEVSVSPLFIDRYKLRTGDFISGKCKREKGEEIPALALIYTVNGLSCESLPERAAFDELTPEYPSAKLKVGVDENDLAGRMIDLFAPVGAGQRAAVIGGCGTGKTELLKHIAKGISANNPAVKVIISAVDTSPEAITDLRRSFSGYDVFTSSFEAGAGAHVRTARLALEYAKRQAEAGKDVLLVLDDLSRLTRAYNSTAQVSSSLSTTALDMAKKYLACAKNAAEGGSLTILTALNPDGIFTDGAAYYGLKDICNLHISLSLQLARKRIFPAIDIDGTYSLGDERLLSEEELAFAAELREKPYEEVCKALKQR